MVAPSSASRWPGERWITVSSATAVSRLATTAAPTPRLMSRRRSDAPILTRKVISAPTTRIASSPSRSMMMNDWTKRLAGETASLSVRSALSSPTASRSRTRVELARLGARGLGPERRELGLEVGGERRILGPNLSLDLLEGHVGVERLRSGAGVAASGEGVGGLDLRPDLVEHRAGGQVGSRGSGAHRREAAQRGRGAVVRRAQGSQELCVGQPPAHAERAERIGDRARGRGQAERGGVQGDGPAILGWKPSLEGGHGGADDADADAAVVVEW